MKPLTIEHAIENNFTAIECVKYFKPDWSDKECDFILWEDTCYPFDFEAMITQLNNKFCIK
jgi:hypothetical protein